MNIPELVVGIVGTLFVEMFIIIVIAVLRGDKNENDINKSDK